jgi:hypothetical protein
MLRLRACRTTLLTTAYQYWSTLRVVSLCWIFTFNIVSKLNVLFYSSDILLSYFIKAMKILHIRCKGVPYQWTRFPHDHPVLQAVFRCFLNDGTLVFGDHPIPVRAYACPNSELTGWELRHLAMRMNEFLCNWLGLAEDKSYEHAYQNVFIPGRDGALAIHRLTQDIPRSLRVTSK